jgi:Dolichyl-phosphate-mannose-protein mannosyltransferase
MTSRLYFPLLIAILAVGSGMRFVHLGTWSFASDELGTFLEVETYRDPAANRLTGPDGKIPQMIPLSMEIFGAAHRLFGSDERGCRTVCAIASSLQLLVLALGLPSLVGRPATLIALLIVALWPEHLYYAQYHRHYAPAALFATIAMLLAARGTTRAMLASAPFVAAAILTHTLCGGMVAGLVLTAFLLRKEGSGPLGVALAIAVGAAIFFAIRILPASRDKATTEPWEGLSLAQSAIRGVIQLSLPTTLFAIVGLGIAWTVNRRQAIVWGTHGLVWLMMLLGLSAVLSFHTAYVFPLAVGLVILAAMGLAEIAQAIEGRIRFAGVGLVVAVAALNLPSVVSHYRDGSRHDFRAASQWLADHAGPDDAIGSVQGDKLDYYQPHLYPQRVKLPKRDLEEWVRTTRPKSGKLWIFLPGGRAGPMEPWKNWIESVGILRKTIVQNRFDYPSYPVYLYEIP